MCSQSLTASSVDDRARPDAVAFVTGSEQERYWYGREHGRTTHRPQAVRVERHLGDARCCRSGAARTGLQPPQAAHARRDAVRLSGIGDDGRAAVDDGGWRDGPWQGAVGTGAALAAACRGVDGGRSAGGGGSQRGSGGGRPPRCYRRGADICRADVRPLLCQNRAWEEFFDIDFWYA